jgi:hypothetical protein
MAKTETAIQAQQLTKLYRGDRLAVEHIGFLRCTPLAALAALAFERCDLARP